MLQLLFLLGTVGPILGQIVHNVQIPRGTPYEVISPNFPALMDMNGDVKSVEWNLKVESDAKIKLICYDIGMVQYDPWTPECLYVSFSVEDGRGLNKKCGDEAKRFSYVSDGPNLKVKVQISTRGSAMIKCVALNTGDPAPEEIVKLDPHTKAKLFKVDGNAQSPLPYLDRLWILESTPGTRMSFQCDLSVADQKPVCGWNSFKFNNGETEEEYCGLKRFVWFSKGNKAKLRFQLDNYGHGRVSCMVQAVTGENPNEYENVVYKEVDSSEHGVTLGARQTSCKCGWTNKGSARIYHGKETGVNEYPWMVHLHIKHETAEGNFGTSCGASIITQRHILTAGHCVVHQGKIAKPGNLKIELGKHDSTKPTGKEITIGAERIFVRDQFIREGASSHDIAVIFTKETIDFGTPIIGPVCIEREELPIINKHILLMGWGRTENSASSKYLRKGMSAVVDPLLCEANPWDICTTSKPSSFCSVSFNIFYNLIIASQKKFKVDILI